MIIGFSRSLLQGLADSLDLLGDTLRCSPCSEFSIRYFLKISFFLIDVSKIANNLRHHPDDHILPN